MQPNREFLLKHPAHFIAFGFGAGLIKNAPGTWGTLVGVPIFLLAAHTGGTLAALLVAAVLFLVGIWASAIAGRALGVADHGGIVIDEIAAMVLVLAYTPRSWWWLLAAFLLFRLFDILKPWPISYFDRTLKGGFGVMFDDLLAALATIGVIFLLRAIF